MEHTNLVILSENNEPVTTSLIIAQAVNYEHHTVLLLVKKYLAKLETFGAVRFVDLEKELKNQNSAFKMQNSEFKIQNLPSHRKSKAGRATEVAILNEQQTYLLIMLMRNNLIIVDIKMRFVSAFFEMRQALQNQQKQLEHHIPTDPDLRAIYEQGQKRGYAIMMGYIAKNQVQGFQCFSNETWEQMQKPAIPDGMTLVNKKSLEHALEVIKWHETNREAFKKTFEATTAIYEQLQNIRDTAGLLTWNYAFYRKEALNLLK